MGSPIDFSLSVKEDTFQWRFPTSHSSHQVICFTVTYSRGITFLMPGVNPSSLTSVSAGLSPCFSFALSHFLRFLKYTFPKVPPSWLLGSAVCAFSWAIWTIWNSFCLAQGILILVCHKRTITGCQFQHTCPELEHWLVLGYKPQENVMQWAGYMNIYMYVYIYTHTQHKYIFNYIYI